MLYCSYGTFSSSVLWWVGVLIIKLGLTPSSLKLMLTRLLVNVKLCCSRSFIIISCMGVISPLINNHA